MNLVQLLNTEEPWKIALDYICRDLSWSQYNNDVSPFLQLTYDEFCLIKQLFEKDLAMTIGGGHG